MYPGESKHSEQRAGYAAFLAPSIALSILLAGSTSWALESQVEQTDRDVETIVVTGTRLTNVIDSIPSFVTVIDKEDIRARQPESVLDLFRMVPGLQVTQFGGRGGVSSVIVRGAEPNFTVVLIDGVKVNDPNNSRGGSFDFSTLNVAEVERIEIVRGAQSSVYGSDGLSGVINVITQSGGDNFGAMVDAEIGADGYGRASTVFGGPIGGKSNFSLGLSTIREGDAVAGNDFSNSTLTGRLSTRVTDEFQLDLTARYADTQSEAFPEDSGGPVYAVLDQVDQRDQQQMTVSGATRVDIGSDLAWFVDASYLKREEDFASPGVADGIRNGVPPNFTDSKLDRIDLGTHIAYALSEAVRISTGVDFNRDKGRSEGGVEFFPGFVLPTDFELKREIFGVFGEMAYAASNGFGVSASLRYDDPDKEKSQSTGRIGAQYRTGSTRVFANWGEGFKLPSFFELGHALVGNPNLKPETSTNWEIGISQGLLDDKLELTLTGFANDFKDLIDFDFDLFTNVNRDEVRTTGFELASGYRPVEQLQLTAHVTYMDVDIKNSDATLRQRPDWRSGVNMEWSITPAVRVRLDWLYTGEAFDSSVPTGSQMLASYHRIDTAVFWVPTDQLRLWLAVDNLVDEDYEESIGFPAAGVRPRAGIRYTF